LTALLLLWPRVFPDSGCDSTPRRLLDIHFLHVVAYPPVRLH
jgi:hypothetical protein